MLKPPRRDCPFHLYTDWSTAGIGAILTQRADTGEEFMVACASRSCNAAEAKYSPYRGELLAVTWGAKTFRPYLAARYFTIHTDSRPLLWLLQAPPCRARTRAGAWPCRSLILAFCTCLES